MSFFSPRPPPMPKDAQQAARDYEGRIRELLESCADHQRHDPEVFLWNARRALEAICHLLLTIHRQRPSRVEKATNEASLDSMIKQLKSDGVLDREQAPRFDLARSHTNLGVHIQKPEREDYATAVADTAHLLPGLLVWLYEDSIAKSYLQKIPSNLVSLIREGGREGPSLKDAATVARTEARATELTARLLRAELEAKEKALRARETRWWRWLGRVAIVAMVSFGMGLGVGGLAGGLDPGVFWEVVASIEAPDAVRVQPGPVLSAQAAGAATHAAQLPPPAPTCPSGMLKIEATRLQLGQPVGGRGNWPKPREKALPPVDVPAFCLDQAPRRPTGSGYDAAAVDACQRRVPADLRTEWLTCVTRDEAEEVCRGAVSGALPTLVQWEAAARAAVRPNKEWVGERFPPAALSRFDPSWSLGDGMWVGTIPEDRAPANPDGAVLLAWNQQPPTNRSPERALRCASPLR